MKKQRKSKNAGFTLVELLVTTLIIAMLMAIGLGVSSFATKKADRSKALAQMEMIANALEEYRAEMGGYPSNTVNYLPHSEAADMATPALVDKLIQFLDPAVISEVGTDKVLLDPWGKEWKYYHNSKPEDGDPYAAHNNSRFGYDLWSVGGDGVAKLYEYDGDVPAGIVHNPGPDGDLVSADSKDEITNWEEN